MVEAAVAMVTRGSIAPGVQAGSGSPPRLPQPVVLVRGDGVQGAEMIVGSATAAVAPGAVVGARIGGGAAGAQLLRPSAVATITQRGQVIRGVGVPLVEGWAT